MDLTGYISVENIRRFPASPGPSTRSERRPTARRWISPYWSLSKTLEKDRTEGTLPTSPPAWGTGSERKAKSHRLCRCRGGETKAIRNAVLTYEALGERDRAIQVLDGAKPELLRELARQPDLSDFRNDSRFKQLKVENSNGGK